MLIIINSRFAARVDDELSQDGIRGKKGLDSITMILIIRKTDMRAD